MMSATMGLNETAGADAVLPKAFDLAELLAIVSGYTRIDAHFFLQHS
ncbi:hypothetical protein [Mucilaginibacter gynuensis]